MFYKLTLVGKPKEIKKELENAWLERLIPIGSGTDLPGFASSEEYP